ncbi:MAG TPA: hypothetical protein PLV21_18160 [Cyclobacteriaceae bacterium]|nr:hypothetical protein [Cyclobacteriaceae bacterium]HRJ83816.1 hypothetical protein [Cyclobacteriaceae bacterium]
MKKINLSSIVLFLGLTAAMFSCFDDAGTDILLDGTFVEIQEATTSAGATVSKSYNRLNDGIAKKDSIRINLVGRQRSTPITVNFAINAASTAVAGVHYNMVTAGTSVTIPANSSFGYIRFDVLADNINPGEVWNLRFDLTGVDAVDVKISENFKTFTRQLRTLCPFSRANFLGNYTCNEPGYGNYTVVSTPGPDANSITITNFWDFGGVVNYTFNPASNAVTLPTQNVVMGGVTYVVSQNGTATYDACTYSFVVPYRVATTGGVTQDTNTHTFTKQ